MNLNNGLCAKCGSYDVMESCYSTFPFRHTCCLSCAYCNLADVIRHERSTLLDQLTALPEDKKTDEIRQCIRGLQDPEVEKHLIESFSK